jgi:beta-mannosidase
VDPETYRYDVAAKTGCFKMIHGESHAENICIVGFRCSALVTINDTDDAVLSNVIQNDMEGSGQHGMYFRVNGAVLFARGANFIPMDQLEGRLTDESHRIAVQSAAAANMNMFRVWGGGMVLPDSFYDACDEEGLLLYHDMMFAQSGHAPVKTAIVEEELRHVVRSLASHSSIVIWNGCNECAVVMGTDTEIYATFVMQTVAEEDDTRTIWPTSPSKLGWKSGVYTLDGRPNGKPLATRNQKDFNATIESHGPYLRSFSVSYPGVNGVDVHL